MCLSLLFTGLLVLRSNNIGDKLSAMVTVKLCGMYNRQY